MQTTTFYRHAIVKRASIDEKARTVALSFSSELPVDRGDVLEVLDHSPGAADLTRLNGGALLLDHDPKQVLGRVESAAIAKDRKGRATVRFGNGPLASEIWQDVVDGIRDQVSVGYNYLDTAQGKPQGGRAVMLVKRWFAIELSVTGIAADHTVGIGRSLIHPPHQITRTMTTIDPPAADDSATRALAARDSNLEAIRTCASELGEIDMTPPAEMLEQATRNNTPVDQFRQSVLLYFRELKKRTANPTASGQWSRDYAGAETRTFGGIIVRNQSFTEFARRGKQRHWAMEIPEPLSLRAFTLAGNTHNPTDYRPGIEVTPQEALRVSDLFGQATTTSKTVSYLQEVAHTNTAGMVAEAGTKPEITLEFIPKTATVRKIAGWVDVSDEMLDDEPAAQGFIDRRVRESVLEREEIQVLTGDGTGENLLGVLNTPGVLVQAKGSLEMPDAIRKAMTKIRIAAKTPATGVIMHPNDLEEMQLLKLADGSYLIGNVFVTNEIGQRIAAPSIWGKPIVESTNIVENTVLVGAFSFGGTIYRRKGISVEASREAGNNFKTNMVTILGEERMTLTINQTGAFCLCTGM